MHVSFFIIQVQYTVHVFLSLAENVKVFPQHHCFNLLRSKGA